MRRVAGFFCNGELGAPGLLKPEEDLESREKARDDGRFVFPGFV